MPSILTSDSRSVLLLPIHPPPDSPHSDPYFIPGPADPSSGPETMGALPPSGPTCRQKRKAKQLPIYTRLSNAFNRFHDHVILETILRQWPLPVSPDGRAIDLSLSPAQQTDTRRVIAREKHTGYLSNYIRSSRYTVWSFLPKQLYFQFTKLANFYFLVIGILQMIPNLSTVGRYTTIVPLVVFVTFSMLKEGYDDYRRYQLDKVENRSIARVLAWSGRKTRKHFHLRRHKTSKLTTTDQQTSASPALAGQSPEIPLSDAWDRVAWENLKVGDIIRLARDDNVPADIVILHATGPNGIAYVETMALDGETNLKSRAACPLLAERCDSLEGIQSCDATLVTEDPNVDLYSFDGRVTLDGETAPLTLDNMMLRGSTLRNTTEAIGVVVNTGEECKIRMNAHKNVRTKKPAIQDQLNGIVIVLVIVVCLLTAGLTAGYVVFRNGTEEDAWYIRNFIGGVPLSQIIVGFLVMFNVLIPLSLYVSMEIIKIGQFYFMGGDIEMYDPVTDTPISVNTTTILENLGQVNYVFSDKTGTLTENILRFRCMSVAGTAFSHGMTPADEPLAQQPALSSIEMLRYMTANPDSIFSHKARQFLLVLALCHTCLPETRNRRLVYQSASPDELALIEAAQSLGWVMIDRPAQRITLSVPTPSGSTVTEHYEILDVIEFTSSRKRMSIVVRRPDGRIQVYCKGADNVIIERLRQKELAFQMARAAEQRRQERRSAEQQILRRRSTGTRNSLAINRNSFNSHRRSLEVSWNLNGEINESIAASDAAIFERTFGHLHSFASEGLRTLLFAYRYLSEAEYTEWKAIYQTATTSLENRQDKIDTAGELLERDFELVGASAIEDKLQSGVPETIDKLRRAGIRVWMITGDKRETAISIGLAARVAAPASEMYILDANAPGSLRHTIVSALNDISRGMVPHSVVVIDGYTLGVVDDSTDEDLVDLFYELAVIASGVIVCRASPAQKAQIVSRIRDNVPRSMTLAIGDGANDIGMIQAAHVGIGISGREGLQAARIADYALAQFRFLQRLLFVHGRWNYMRTGKYILATFWKEIAFFPSQAFFQGYAGFSGTSMYESWTLTVYNVFFTSLPVIALGILDRDLKAETLLKVPELYSYGQTNQAFNFRKWIGWTTMGIAQSVTLYYFMYLQYRDTLFTEDTSLYAMGSAPFTAIVIFINLKLLVLELHSKTIITWAVFALSNIAWWLWMFILCYGTSNEIDEYQTYHTFVHNFGYKLSWWATLLVILFALLMTELVSEALIRIYLPEDIDWMQRIEKDGKVDGVVQDLEQQASLDGVAEEDENAYEMEERVRRR